MGGKGGRSGAWSRVEGESVAEFGLNCLSEDLDSSIVLVPIEV